MKSGKRWVNTADHLPDICRSLVTRTMRGGWETDAAGNGRYHLSARSDVGTLHLHLDYLRPEIQMVHLVEGRRTGRLVFPSGGISDLNCGPDDVDAVIARIMGPVEILVSMRPSSDAENAEHQAGIDRLMRMASAAVVGSGLDFERVRFLHLPDAWQSATISTPDPHGTGVDGVLGDEWVDAIARTGRDLPAIVRYTQPAAPASELVYDTTISGTTLVIDSMDAMEALRVAKDLA